MIYESPNLSYIILHSDPHYLHDAGGGCGEDDDDEEDVDLLLEVHLVAQPHRERQTLRDEGHAQNQALNNGK